MTRFLLCALAMTLMMSVTSGAAHAELRPDKVRTADAKKTGAYLLDGMVVGGDQAINEVIVKDIRRAANPAGFDRIVIDLQGNRNGEAVAIPRPPFYQVSINKDEHRVVVTLFGKPKLSFDAKQVLALFKKSQVVDRVVLFPLLEENSWTFAFEMKASPFVEVFELTNPVRIILDIKPQHGAVSAAKSVAPAPAPDSAIEPEAEAE